MQQERIWGQNTVLLALQRRVLPFLVRQCAQISSNTKVFLVMIVE